MAIPGILQKLRPKAKIKEVLEDPKAFATTLVTVLIDQYGTEALEWSPTTFQLEFLDDYRAEIPQGNLDKLLAAVNILTTDDFFQRLPRFVQLCNVLTGSILRPRVFDPADASECAWGMTEAVLLYPPDEDENEDLFADEIRYYLGEVLVDEGIRTPPDLLRLAIYPTSSGKATFPGALDPSGFAMEFKVQQDRGEEIKDMVRSKLASLMQQLQSLPLQEGNVSDLIESMQTR